MEQRLIDANNLGMGKANPGIFVCKEYAHGWNNALQAVVEAAPTIDPETIPIVRQLRAELDRVTAERDAALRELRSIQTHTRSLRDYVDDEIHPVVDYSIYLNLREAVDTIDSWQHITPDGAIKEATP